MKAPIKPSNEKERLKALIDYQVLDTHIEAEYQDIAHLASQICQTNIAVISLVDDERQWFKGITGLDAKETSRNISFCGHAILQDDIFEISDAKADERFSDNPLVTGPVNIQFYAGMPLKTPEGFNIGTLCVIHDKPISLSEEQKKSLKIFAKHVIHLFELNKNKKKLSAIISNMNEGYVKYNQIGSVIDFNIKALEILELSAEQLTSINSQSSDWIRVKEDGTPFLATDHPAMIALETGKRVQNVLIGLKKAELIKKWIKITANVVLLENSEVKDQDHHVFCTFEDVSEFVFTKINLETTLNLINIGTFELDFKNKIAIWNKKMFQNWGMEISTPFDQITFDELVGLIHPEDREQFQKNLDEAIISNREYFSQYRIRKINGKISFVSSRGRIVKDENGNLSNLFGISWDSTEDYEKQNIITHQSEKLLSINKIAPVGLFETDHDGKCIFVNDHWLKISGRTEQESMGDGWINSIHPDDVEKVYFEWAEAVKFDRHFYLEYRFRNKDGQIFWVIGNAAAMKDRNGKITGFLGSIQDISLLKKVEAELSKSKKFAEDANNIKSEFLASMSHEIRTPLNGVLGLANLLTLTNLDKEQKEYVNGIMRSGEGLMTIINDILDISKIESGKNELNLMVFDLESLIKDCLFIIKPQAVIKNIAIEMNIPSPFIQSWIGDSGRIRQILINIIGNAVKFTHQGSVKLDVDKWEEAGLIKGLKFTVTDTGIGLSEESIQKLFKNFVQVDNKISSKYGGTGLGLSICKKLCDLMNGKIEVTSVKGQGSIFSIYLGSPALKVNSNQSVGLSEIVVTKSNSFNVSDFDYSLVKVLIAEDNQINQIVIKNILLKTGIKHIEFALNGIEAVQLFSQFEYDLIFMDCFMPEMDGYETTKKIRELEVNLNKKNKTPIVAMTASAMQGDREKCIEVGMDNYLTKPINIIKLKEVLEKFIRKNNL